MATKLITDCRLSLQFEESNANSQNSLQGLLSSYSINTDGLPNIAISELSLLASSHAKSYGLRIRAADVWQMNLGQASIALQDLLADLTYAGGKATGTLQGRARIAQSELSLSAKLEDSSLRLSGSIPHIDLSALIQAFTGNIALPDELPNVQFSDINLAITPATGAFNIDGIANIDWNFNAGKQQHIKTEVKLTLNRTVSDLGESTIYCKISLKGAGQLSLIDDVVINQFSLNFELKEDKDWFLSGSVTAALLDNELQLSASYIQTEHLKTLTLSTASQTPISLVAIDGVGGLSISNMALGMAKESIPGRSEVRYLWQISASGRVHVNGVFDFAGALSLYKSANETGFSFLPTSATVSLPLTGSPYKLVLEVGAVSIIRRAGTTGQEATWAFESSVAIAFQDLPKKIQALLPTKTTAFFKADQQAVSLRVDRLLKRIDLKIPDIQIDGNNNIQLGTVALDVSNLSVLFNTKKAELSADIGLGLPAGLNNIFGVDASGRPEVDLFRVYDPKAADVEETLVKLKLSIGTEGIRINPVSFPIKALTLIPQQDGTAWCNCEFGQSGEFGSIRFQMPEFSLDTKTSSFVAKGGFETIKPIQLPFTLLKSLLVANGLKDAAAILPNSLPLKPVSILDDKNNFRVDELLKMFRDLKVPLPDEITSILEVIGSRANQLPDRFKDYLNIQIPDSFSFDIAVTPDGGARIDVRVLDPNKPIRLLIVGMNSVTGMPIFTGVTLRSFSFGEILGGSLFTTEIDMDFDQYCLSTLASAILMPSTIQLLPSSRALGFRLIIRKLFAIIVYQTSVPIPIPLFFDELGIEYLGMEGVEVQSHASFPMPKVNMGEVTKLISGLKPFFTTPDYLLEPKDLPTDMNLIFSLGKNYVQLPKYLSPPADRSDKFLGSKTQLLTVNAAQEIANFLNALKTLSLNDLIQAVPLEHRVGNSAIALGCLSAEASWVLTTPGEFSAISRQPSHSLKIPPDALSVLPPAKSTDGEQGLVTFLRGRWTIQNVADFETMFALVASGSMGFQTGFKVSGMIADVLDVELAGRIAVTPPTATSASNPPESSQASSQTSFQLAGHSHLTIFNREIFLGDVQVIDDSFWLKGRFDLFPESVPLTAKGNLEGYLNNSELALKGDIEATLAGITLAKARGNITNEQIVLEGELFGITTRLETRQKNGELVAVEGSIKGTLGGLVQLDGIANISAAGAVISGTVKLLGFKSITTIRVSATGFTFHTEGSLFSLFEASISVTGKSLSDPHSFHLVVKLQNDLIQRLTDESIKIIQATASAANAELDKAQQDVANAQRDVDQLNADIAYWRTKINAERAAAQRDFQNAQNSVNHEQNKVNGILNTIRYKENEINHLKHHEGFWFWGKWVNHPWAIAKIASLGIEIGALYTAYGTATAALEVAKTSVRSTGNAVASFPVDLDPRITPIFARRDTATVALTVAHKALEVVKRGAGSVAAIGAEIIRIGAANALEIRAIRIETTLAQMLTRQVAVDMDLKFIKNIRKVSLNLNFNDLLGSSRELVKLLIPP